MLATLMAGAKALRSAFSASMATSIAPSINANQTAYDRYYGLTGMARGTVVVYALIVPLIFLVLLLFNRRAIMYGPPTPLSSALNFLCNEYTPTFYYRELVEVSKKLLLVGVFMGGARQGDPAQHRDDHDARLPRAPSRRRRTSGTTARLRAPAPAASSSSF